MSGKCLKYWLLHLAVRVHEPSYPCLESWMPNTVLAGLWFELRTKYVWTLGSRQSDPVVLCVCLDCRFTIWFQEWSNKHKTGNFSVEKTEPRQLTSLPTHTSEADLQAVGQTLRNLVKYVKELHLSSLKREHKRTRRKSATPKQYIVRFLVSSSFYVLFFVVIVWYSPHASDPSMSALVSVGFVMLHTCDF